MTTPKLVEVPFPAVGDEITVVVAPDGRKGAVIKRLCENLGVSFAAQFVKLNNAPWAGVSIIETPDQRGILQPQSVLWLDRVPMWLTSINPAKVRPELRDKLVRYQCEAADVLGRYFGGQSTAPAAPAIEHDKSLIERIEQLESGYEKILKCFRAIQVPTPADVPPGYRTLKMHVAKKGLWLPPRGACYQGQIVARKSRELRKPIVQIEHGVRCNYYHPEPLEDWESAFRMEHPTWRQPNLFPLK